MFARIARAVTARPWFVIVGWVVAAATIIIFAPRISHVTNSDQAAFLPDTAESVRAAELARRAFPDAHGATAVIVVKRVDGAAVTPADVETISRLVQRLAGGSATVRGIQFDPQRSISANGAIGLVGVGFTAAAADESVRDAVGTLRRDTATALTGSGLTAGMTGEAAIVGEHLRLLKYQLEIVGRWRISPLPAPKLNQLAPTPVGLHGCLVVARGHADCDAHVAVCANREADR